MEIEITETSLPGVGRRYEVPTDEGSVVVVVRELGGAELSVSSTADGAVATARLDPDQARALSALLTGARYCLVPDEGSHRPRAPGRRDRAPGRHPDR